MPFRRKVIGFDEVFDADEPVDLPDDLEQLGAQLGFDAEHLAKVYPADHCDRELELPTALQRKRRRRSDLARRAVLGGSLTAILLLAVTTSVLIGWLTPSIEPHASRERAKPMHSTTDVLTDAPAVAPRMGVALPARNEPLGYDATSLLGLNQRPIISRVGHTRDAELDLLEFLGTDSILLAF